jgi:hypothetical protein
MGTRKRFRLVELSGQRRSRRVGRGNVDVSAPMTREMSVRFGSLVCAPQIIILFSRNNTK